MAGRVQYDLSSAHNGSSVTPSDATILAAGVRGLWVGVTGDVAIKFVGGATVTLGAVPAGTLLAVQVTQVLATGTTATGIVALY